MLRTDEKYMEKNTDDDKERLSNPYVVCVHHGTDLDGWTSAALVQRWAEENGLMPFFFPMNHDAPVPCREIIENFRPRYFIVADYSLTVKEYRELCDTRVECDVPFDFLCVTIMPQRYVTGTRKRYSSTTNMPRSNRGTSCTAGSCLLSGIGIPSKSIT